MTQLCTVSRSNLAEVLGWPKSLFMFFCKMHKNTNELYGQPSNYLLLFRGLVVSDSLRPHGLAARQASLSITNSRSLLKLRAVESMMPFNHLILCRPLLSLPSIFPSMRIFSKELALCIRWPKYWSFGFSISPFNEHSFQ